MHIPLTPLSLALSIVPQAVHNELLSRIFNHLLKGQALLEQLQELNGKRVAIHITDHNQQLIFIIKRGRFYRAPAAASASWDVRISGRLEHFWQLVTRNEDPDTLFFHRQLAIEGETATGLYIKNLLDSLEYDWAAHMQAVLGAQLGGAVTRVGRKGLQLLHAGKP